MKNSLLFLFILCLSISYSQCPMSNILLTTQAEIDAFATNYPGCSVLNVDIRISGPGINDLSGLSQITGINGEFSVSGNSGLVTMNGLSTINFFGANSELTIYLNSSLVTMSNFTGSINTSDYSGLSIQNNASLNSISGLSGITNSNSLWINNNDSLTSLNGVENISVSGTILGITNNELLTDITALNGNMGEFSQIQIGRNPLLTSLSGIEGINFTTVDPSGLIISDNIFSNLDPLSSITNPPEIISIVGSNLTSISGLSNIQGEIERLSIRETSLLSSLNGLNGISGVTDFLEISDNISLQNLSGLENILNAGGSPFLLMIIRNNDPLDDISAISNLETNSLIAIVLEDNPSLSVCSNLLVCRAIPLDKAVINNNAMGCNSTAEVQQECILGILEDTSPNDIRIYPNPVENDLILSTRYTSNNIQVKIFSSTGELLLESSKYKNDVSSLSSGLYFVQIKTAAGNYSTKFIKK